MSTKVKPDPTQESKVFILLLKWMRDLYEMPRGFDCYQVTASACGRFWKVTLQGLLHEHCQHFSTAVTSFTWSATLWLLD